jgi:hypothetical protein
MREGGGCGAPSAADICVVPASEPPVRILSRWKIRNMMQNDALIPGIVAAGCFSVAHRIFT